MMRIVESIQLRILPVDGKGVLGQIVGADTEKIHFFCQFFTHHNRCRSLDHNTLLRFSACHALLCQFLLHFCHDFLDPVYFIHTDDHGIHDGDVAEGTGSEQCAQLGLKNLRSGQTDTDGPTSHCRILLRFHLEVVTFFICTDIQGTDDHRLTCHGLRHGTVDLELFFLRGKGLSLQIDKFTSKQSDTAGIVLQYCRQILAVTYIGIEHDLLTVNSDIFSSLQGLEQFFLLLLFLL